MHYRRVKRSLAWMLSAAMVLSVTPSAYAEEILIMEDDQGGSGENEAPGQTDGEEQADGDSLDILGVEEMSQEDAAALGLTDDGAQESEAAKLYASEDGTVHITAKSSEALPDGTARKTEADEAQQTAVQSLIGAGDFEAARYTVVAADGSEVTFPEDTVFTVETQMPEGWKEIAGAYAYDDGALKEVKHSGEVFEADTLDDLYVLVNAAEADAVAGEIGTADAAEAGETELAAETEIAGETELEAETETAEETELEAETETAEETEPAAETETTEETELAAETETAEETELATETETAGETELTTEPETAGETELATEETELAETESETEAIEVETASEDELIATQEGPKMLMGMYGGANVLMIEVLSLNPTISAQLEGDCTLSVEEITSGEEYDAVKAKLNEENDNRVVKYGYLKLEAKDADGNVIDLNDSMTYVTSVTYAGVMANVTNEPTAIYSASNANGSWSVTAGLLNEGSQSYMEGFSSFKGMLVKASDRIAVVAEGDMVKQCPLNQGVYTITANLTVLGDNNEVLPGVQVYLGNPNFPPILPLSYNAKLVVDKDKKMTITIEHFSEIFQIVSMSDGEDIHIKEIGYTKSETDSAKATVNGLNAQFRHENRIDRLVLELDNANGLYEFGACTQSPIILAEDKNMKMHLQVDFDECVGGFDDSQGEAANYSFEDSETGVGIAIKTTDTALEEELKDAVFTAKVNKNSSYAQLLESMYYDGTLAYHIYDVSLKNKDGKEIDLSKAVNTEKTLTMKTGYSDSRMWKLDGLNLEKMRRTSITTEDGVSSCKSMELTLGTIAVVDNTSGTQYSVAKAINDDIALTCYQQQGTSAESVEITEDTDFGKIMAVPRVAKEEKAMGTVYTAELLIKGSENPLGNFSKNGKRKLGLYVPYDASKYYYFVSDDGSSVKAEELDTSNHNEQYVMLDLMQYSDGTDSTSYGMKYAYEGVAASKDTLNCYVLVTDKKVASLPMAPKTREGKNVTFTYTGQPQTLLEGGSHYTIVDGALDYTNAGTYEVKIQPEDGYCWADGSNTEKTLTVTIQKHKLAVRYKSEIVIAGGTPNYTLEYGYRNATATGSPWKDYYFVDGESEDTASGFEAPTLEKQATDTPGSYVLTPAGGKADNYEFVQMVSGTLYVVESEDKIVKSPEIVDDTVYKIVNPAGIRFYVVPKDVETIEPVTGVGVADENAPYIYTGEITANTLGKHTVMVKLKEGYVWEDATSADKSLSYMIRQVADKPEAVTEVVYTGDVVSPFTEETLEELKAGTGRWTLPSFISGNSGIWNTQYEEKELGDYQVSVMPADNYCWDETGDRTMLEYKWSVVESKPDVPSDKEIASTETITANLSLKGSDASAAGLTVLEGLVGADGHAYLTNPNAPTADSNEDNDPNWVQTPPTTAVENNATLAVYTDGTMSVTVPVKNAVFTLQKLGTCDALSEDDVQITKRSSAYGEKTSRIDSITIPVTEKEGMFVFNGCEVYPTLLRAGYTVPLTLTIGGRAEAEPVSIADAAVSGIKNAVYTGKAITQSGLKVVVGGVVTLTEGTDYTVAYKNNVNAGKATLTITGIGNYKGEITKTFTIGRKAVAKKPVARTGLVYNGKSQTGVASVANVTFTGTRARTNAGTYTVKASVGSNYKWPDGTTAPLTLKWTIKKAAQKVTTKVSTKTYSYTTLSKKAYSFAAGASASGKGKLTYKVIKTPAKAASYITVSAAGVVTMRKGAPAGTYQIRVSAAANTNYNAASKVVTVNVKKGTQPITAKVTTKTYTASALKKAAASYTIGASASGKGKLTYKVTSTPAKAAKYISVTSAGKVTMKKNAPKGTYVITITAAETANYLKGTKTVKVVVK